MSAPSANLAANWRADWAYTDTARTTLATSSGVDTVASLKDLTVNAYHLTNATGANRPLWISGAINGHPSVRFDGLNDSLGIASVCSTPRSTYIVFKSITVPDNGYGIFDGTPADHVELQSLTNGRLRVYNGNFLGDTADTAMTTNTWGKVCYVANGVTSVLRVNDNPDVTGDDGGQGATGFTLGSGASAFPTNVEVAEVLVYSVAHDSTQRQAVMDYIDQTYFGVSSGPSKFSVVL